MSEETYNVKKCYWEQGQLVVVTESSTFKLAANEGIQALKSNRWRVPGSGDGDDHREIPLFDPDEPRRMALIQERISHLRD